MIAALKLKRWRESARQAPTRPGWSSVPGGTMPFDPWLLGVALSIVFTGFVMITSASMDVAAQKFGGPFFFCHPPRCIYSYCH